MAAPITKLEGKSNPLTIFSPTRVWMRWPFWIILKVFSYIPLVSVKHLLFIHFAGWQPINRNRFPRLSATQPKEDLKDDYFLFTTNFNGTWDQYIDAFGLIKGVRRGLFFLWCSSRGFHGSWPIRPFKRYIHYNEYQLDLYYNAYPGMSVRDIRNAWELSNELDQFIRETDAYDSAERFLDDYGQFVDKVCWRLSDSGSEGDRTEIPTEKRAQPRSLSM
ncbi:MAG TPA: hypothetical protein VFG52_01685 [Xanthomonadales bacterium]|nr:hypothetical protein [Xanthomonadales bacterium]